MSTPTVNDVELYRIPDAMRLLKLSRTTIYEQIRKRRLRAIKQGRATLISPTAIRAYIALLESEAATDSTEVSI